MYGNTGELEEGVWVSRRGTLLISPFRIGPVPLDPLLQTFEAGSLLPGRLLPCVLKDTLQGQALGEALALLGPRAGCPPSFLLPRRHCSLC